MALRDLVDGECGARNPLMKVASHFTEDKTFRHEQRHVRPGAAPVDLAEDEMVREFLADTSVRGAGAGPSTFHMGALLQEMRDLEKNNFYGASIQQGPNIAHIAMNEASNWASEFMKEEQNDWGREFLEQPRLFPPGAMGGPDYLAEWENQWDDLTTVNETTAAVNHREGVALAQTATEVIKNIGGDPKFANSEFLQFMQKISSGEETLGMSGSKANWADEFLQSPEGLNADRTVGEDWVKDFVGTSQNDLADEWTREFTNTDSAEVFRNVTGTVNDIGGSTEDFWKQLEQDWQKVAEENPDYGFLKEQKSQNQTEYTFEKENPFENASDPFSLAVKKREEGDLPAAILLFEAALKKDPQHANAWELLGLSLAENEQDPGAINAYKQCLSLEPSNLNALMGLAVSYTNESYQYQACKALEDWLRNNPKYSNLTGPSEPGPVETPNFYTTLVPREIYNRVQDVFLRAARSQPGTDLDPDVQTGLGVLLNLSSDYEKAADCFRAALNAKPNDALLWNRLGATLANGGRSEEAVQAYSRALEISPGFIRARYNLAVSCINLGAHREAAEHLVSALQFQAGSSERVMSDNIWSTLRMALNVMNRKDLLPDIETKNLARIAAEFAVS
nr:EOG090X054E [Eulimnadia texana]